MYWVKAFISQKNNIILKYGTIILNIGDWWSACNNDEKTAYWIL